MPRGPVPYTCPDIDRMISMLEELRKSNDSLREWGAEQEDRANDLQQEIDNLNRKIDDLNDRIAELESQS